MLSALTNPFHGSTQVHIWGSLSWALHRVSDHKYHLAPHQLEDIENNYRRSQWKIMTPGLIRNSHCFFMSLNLPLVKWRISSGHPRTPPVSVANLQTSECWRCHGTDCPPTPPVFLSFYNLMLSRFLLSALMNTLQSPVMEQRPGLVSFPRSNHQKS